MLAKNLKVVYKIYVINMCSHLLFVAGLPSVVFVHCCDYINKPAVEVSVSILGCLQCSTKLKSLSGTYCICTGWQTVFCNTVVQGNKQAGCLQLSCNLLHNYLC